MSHLVSLQSSETARTQLSSLLLNDEDLARLPELQREYERKQEEAAKEFQAVSRQQRRSNEAALAGLKRARGALAKFNSLFGEIRELCDTSDASEPTYDSQLLRRLATVHSNVDETYRSTESVAGLPEAAVEAEAMISEMNLVEAHVYLSPVEATVYRINIAMELAEGKRNGRGGGGGPSGQMRSLEPYFERVHTSMTKFEHELWWVVRSFMEVDVDRRALVAALRVIETQELVDSRLVAEGLGDCSLRKAWRHRCIQNMSNAVSEKSIHVLQRCSKIVVDAAGELRDVLGEAEEILHGMHDAVERVHMCFPERYRIRDFMQKESRAFKENVLEILGGYSEEMGNGDIMFVLDWEAKVPVGNVGVDGADGGDGAGGTEAETSGTNEREESHKTVGASVKVFMDEYLTRMDRALRNWLKNILNADFEGNTKADKKGLLFTPGPQDMYRLIEEQERFVSGSSLMGKGVRRQISAILKEYLIEEYRRRIDDEENLEVLCAVCNNLMVLDDLLSEYQLEGFRQRARDAAVRCGRVIYLDPGFGELFDGFFSDDEGWKRAGTRTGSLMATLEDFMADFRVWLGPEMGDICMREIGDGCCRYYVASMLSGLTVIDSLAIDRMENDLSRMRDKFLLESVGLGVIEGIREFFASNSVESFVIGWSSLLDSGGLGGPALGLIQGLVHKRVDLTRSDCREIIAALQSTVVAGSQQGEEGLVGIQEANKGLRRDAIFSTAWRGLYW